MADDPSFCPDDPCDRQVLLAVELLDPLTLRLVQHGVEVKAAGLEGKPIVSRSGRFVWLREGQAWPQRISVDPKKLPFAVPSPVQPPRPVDLDQPKEAEQRVAIVLQPTPAYDFSPGVTAVRGALHESLDDGAPAVAGARVELAWRDLTTRRWVAAAWPATTDATGQFAVFLRLVPVPPARPDLLDGMALGAQLRLTHAGTTVATKDDYEFSTDPAVPKGRLREGLPLSRAVRLGWRELNQ